jgi:hypothetical protein
MSEGSEGGMVCGFGDLESGVAGLAWDLAGGGGVLLSDERVAAGEVQLQVEDDRARIEMTLGDRSVEVGLAPRGDSVTGEGGGGAAEAAACMASVRVGDTDRPVSGPGHATRWPSDPLKGAAIFRHLAIETADGPLLIVTARGQPGLEGHDGEQASAWLIDNNGALGDFEETLISTQYDGDGRPTRFGLELWPRDEAPPKRVTASLLGGAEAGGSWAGLFRCHIDGAEGLGGYLLWRA